MSQSQMDIPRSLPGGGKYLSVKDSTVTFKANAWLLEKSEVLEQVRFIGPERPRDISDAVNAQGVVKVKDLQVRYPDGGVSTPLPVGNIIVEYRPNMGTKTIRRGMGGKAHFETGYMITYASVGIPTQVFNVIVREVERSSPEYNVRFNKVVEHDGYSWMPVKIPAPYSPLMVIIKKGKDYTSISSILDFMLSMNGQSVMGYGAFSFRIKHTRASNMPDNNAYEFGLTLIGFQATDITKRCAPPLNNRPAARLVDIDVSDALQAVIDGMRTAEVEVIDQGATSGIHGA